jgi:hypothetical protein
MVSFTYTSTSYVPNYDSFDCFYFKFDCSSYLKHYAKYHIFYCGLVY